MLPDSALTLIERIFSGKPPARYTMGGDGLYVPGQISDIRMSLDAADARAGERFLDLGSGDGRAACVAAAMGCRAMGIEADEILHRRSLDARERLIRTAGHLDIELVRGDFLEYSYIDADVIFYYGGGNTRYQKTLYARLERELHPGARLIVFRTARRPDIGLDLNPRSRAPDFYIYSK